MKKGHKMKIWSERWFVLRSNTLSYYLSEDLVDRRGDVVLDHNSSVEVFTRRRPEMFSLTSVMICGTTMAATGTAFKELKNLFCASVVNTLLPVAPRQGREEVLVRGPMCRQKL